MVGESARSGTHCAAPSVDFCGRGVDDGAVEHFWSADQLDHGPSVAICDPHQLRCRRALSAYRRRRGSHVQTFSTTKGSLLLGLCYAMVQPWQKRRYRAGECNKAAIHVESLILLSRPGDALYRKDGVFRFCGGWPRSGIRSCRNAIAVPDSMGKQERASRRMIWTTSQPRSPR